MMNGKLITVAGVILALVISLFAPAAVAAQPQGNAPARLIVTFDEPARQAVEDYVHENAGQVLRDFTIVPAMAILLNADRVSGLQGVRGVRQVGPDGRIHAIDVELDNSWGVKHIGAGNVHAYNKGSGVKLAIIDTGVDYNHPDLNGNYAGGYDFVNNDTNPFDDNGHGTHVAGIAAAEDDGAGVVGGAPEADIYALKVLDAGGNGYWSDFMAALEWAANNGMQVANMSLGASRDAPGVHDAVKAAYNGGVLLVAAAGNSGNPGGRGNSIEYPARYEEVIAVGATDQNDTRASFSSTGDQLELAAPGVGITSTIPDGGYESYSGTSMASPHVAGTAALVIASGITDTNGNRRVNDEVRLLLQQTADDLGASGKDSQYGYGLVDADEAAPPPAGNQAPVANAGLDQNVKTGSTVYLDGTASYDPDGDPLTYSWSFVSRPSGSNATLSGASTATPTFVADVDGTYEVASTVSDAELSSTDSVVVTAAPNRAPVANAGPDQSVATGSTVQLDGTGSYDPDADSITYNWIFLSKPSGSGATLSGADTAEPTFTADIDGSYEMELTVSDGELTATDTVIVAATTATGPTTVSVTSITYSTEGGKNGDQHLRIEVALVDNLGNSVVGASVSIRLDNTTTGQSWTGTGTTGTDGKVTFKLNGAPAGTYTTTVTDVSAAGLTWDGTTPQNSFTK